MGEITIPSLYRALICTPFQVRITSCSLLPHYYHLLYKLGNHDIEAFFNSSIHLGKALIARSYRGKRSVVIVVVVVIVIVVVIEEVAKGKITLVVMLLSA